jgi:alkyl hydroperoxide reductase subunit AhpC
MKNITIRIGDLAPDFVANTTNGEMRFHKWLDDSWGILLSHPSAFTAVCTTELGEVAKLKKEFDLRNTKVISISADTIESYEKWIHDINETQKTKVIFPLIADPEFMIARLFGMVHPAGSAHSIGRSVFIISPDKRINLIITYPASTGRNFEEIIRVIDSLQLATYKKIVTPANWRQGEDCVILPTLTNEEAKSLFPRGYNEIKPYLRFTPQPRVDYHLALVN